MGCSKIRYVRTDPITTNTRAKNTNSTAEEAVGRMSPAISHNLLAAPSENIWLRYIE
jgi:hypothetical protein